MIAALLFLWRIEAATIKLSPSLMSGGLVFLLVCALVPKYNAEVLLNRVAVSLSGADQAHQAPAWRLGEVRSSAE